MNQSKYSPEFECTTLCNSKQHASILTSAITKRAVSDAALASFLRYTCQNFLRAVDYQGRSLLHMVASRGRRLLLEWLLNYYVKNPHIFAIIDMKDSESGYTAFHRSIYYGQIHAAIVLMKNGINVMTLDNEEINGFDLALLDRHPRFELSRSVPCETYVWGANTNYTLGINSQQHRNNPELLASFTKQGIYIKQVCLGKFHSVFVSSCGRVWTCGHGEGGRLGVATRDTHVLPTHISLPEPCIRAAVGRDHTILLLESGYILSCGLNDYHQLGQVPPPQLQLSPRAVKLRLSNVLDVCAARYHSAAYNARYLYTWGLNGGQLGHAKDGDKTIITPKKVTGIGNGQDFKIISVSVSDGATVVATSRGDILLLYQYQCKRISIRLHYVKHVQVIGGEAIGGDKLTEYQKRITVLMLNTSGSVYLWNDTSGQLTRCVYNTNRPMVVKETALTKEFIFFTTNIGEAFQANIMPKKVTNIKSTTDSTESPKNKGKVDVFKYDAPKNCIYELIDRDDCILLKLTRLPNIHRAVDICCDSKANNFAVLQVSPNSSLIDLPQITSSDIGNDLSTLLNDASECDNLHDVLIKVNNYVYSAHQYVVAHGSDYFKKMCLLQSNNNNIESIEKFTIEIENIHPIILKQLLIYLYTGTCDLMVVGPNNIRIESHAENLQYNNEINVQGNNNLSAFEVYNTPKKVQKNNKKNKDNLNNQVKESVAACDPVRQLQAAAKKLGVTTLYKILDKYGWSRGCVIIRNDNNKYTDIKHHFDRNGLMELHDAVIKCSDGDIIKAHRCILAARLEYFNGMFCHSWSENTSHLTSITLPFKFKMLNPIITFLYTDECPELNECDDLEYLYNMLVICDQLFITRMREMCEVALSKLMTLKNISDIIQFSDLYNCPQLKKCCMEYISLNLSVLLENRSLESIPYNILEELSEYYIGFNPIMSQRIITPFSESYSDEIILSLAEKFPIDLEDCNDEVSIQKDVLSSGKKKARTRKSSQSEAKKADDRNTSPKPTGNDVHLYLKNIEDIKKTEEKEKSNWTEVSSVQKKTQKIVQARLKIISDVKENQDLLQLKNESFTKLIKNEFSSGLSPPRCSTSSPSNHPDNDIDELGMDSVRNLKTALNITVVNTKLSQKQRKRLASENNSVSTDQFNIIEEKEPENNTCAKNPWKKIEPVEPVIIEKNKISFSDILEDERKQKENLVKMMTKSLALTQIEDKAIEDIAKYYYANVEDDEKISVIRVPCTQLATPQWINKSFTST